MLGRSINMFPRTSLGKFQSIQNLQHATLFGQISNDTMQSTCIEKLCKNLAKTQTGTLKKPLVIFQPSVGVNDRLQLHAIAKVYDKIKSQHGDIFILASDPNIDQLMSQESRKNRQENLPFTVYYLLNKTVQDLIKLGTLRTNSRHAFLLTPAGGLLKEKEYSFDEPLNEDGAALLKWGALHNNCTSEIIPSELFKIIKQG